MRYEHLFFDLDGTLTDPALGITNAIIYARKKWGMEPGKNEDYYKFIGPPMPKSYEEFWGLSPEEARRFLADYREYFGSVGLFENEVYPGMPQLLAALKKQGRKLYVATTKPTGFSERIVEHFDLAKYFEIISGSDPEVDNAKADVIRRARDACGVDMSRALMIGDRLHDVEGARECSIPCVGVAYGYGGRAELEAAGAAWIADTVEALSALLLTEL